METDWMRCGATKVTWMSRRERLAPLIRRDTVDNEDLEAYHSITCLSHKYDYGHAPNPEDVTDYAIAGGRKQSPTRTVVHYM